ncbi:MAG: hypothetical protein K6F50_09705 [Kiritimatiellae bacterium]|nr:hypothetical protein [Kiritimatiellia bacterium]
MNENQPLLLIGVGTAGSAIASGVGRAFGGGLRYVLADTDASSGASGEPFILLGGDRLSGHGTGGDPAQARLAAEDSLASFDAHLEGVRLAVIAAGLGGGTGAGATVAICRHLKEAGIPSLVFATMPFSFQGDDCMSRAAGMTTSISEEASAAIFLPLDKLVAGTDNMDEAMRRAIGAMASGITLFWRMLAKPGYIRLDVERMRRIIGMAGNGRFATVTEQGPDRAAKALDALKRSSLLAEGAGPVKSIVCGILAGEDLRLSEVGAIADGIRSAFGERASFDIATVNDEATFTGRLSVAVMLFESGPAEDKPFSEPAEGSRRGSRRRSAANPLAPGPQGRGRFNNVEPTIWRGEDLDTPTFLRRNVSLDI